MARSSSVSESASPRDEASTIVSVTEDALARMAPNPRPTYHLSTELNRNCDRKPTREDVHVVSLSRVQRFTIVLRLGERGSRSEEYPALCMFYGIFERTFR